MFTTHTAGDKVAGGFYFNIEDWTMHVAPREGAMLPGKPAARYIALPTVVMLIAAPVLSIGFVIFLPFIGLAMVARAGIDKAALMLHDAREKTAASEPRARVTK